MSVTWHVEVGVPMRNGVWTQFSKIKKKKLRTGISSLSSASQRGSVMVSLWYWHILNSGCGYVEECPFLLPHSGLILSEPDTLI